VLAGVLLVSACGAESGSGGAPEGPVATHAAGRLAAVGEDPRILVDVDLEVITPSVSLWWRLRYDPAGRCLYAEPSGTYRHAVPVVPVWSSEAEPVSRGERRGVDTGDGVILEGGEFSTSDGNLSGLAGLRDALESAGIPASCGPASDPFFMGDAGPEQGG
jgi:hypothetical protein